MRRPLIVPAVALFVVSGAFNVNPTDTLYLSPDARVRIW
jgi:predicted metalloendopeptidase